MQSIVPLAGSDLTIFHPPSELTESCESLNSLSREIPGNPRRINSGNISSSGAGDAPATSFRVVPGSGAASFLAARLRGSFAAVAGGAGGCMFQQTRPETVVLVETGVFPRKRFTRGAETR